VLGGVALQLVLAVVLIKFPPVVAVFQFFAEGVAGVIALADEGIAFIFGRELLKPGRARGGSCSRSRCCRSSSTSRR
jgi:nucleoside permease NupC